MSTKRNTHLVDIYLEKITLICHPHAQRAWNSWHGLIRQFSPSVLPIETLILIQQQEPIHVLKNSSNNKYQFISGFASVSLVKSTEFKKATFIIHNKLTPDEIELIAWVQIFKTTLFDLDNAVGLASLYESVNQYIPGRISRLLIKHKKLRRHWLAKICDVTENALRWQLTRLAKPSKDKKSIFDRIIED